MVRKMTKKMTYRKMMKSKSQIKMIIGFTGRKGHGKDTAAKAFPGATTVAFAEPLKRAAMAMWDLTEDQVFDDRQKEVVDERYGKTPRQMLQWLGSDVIRDQFDKNHWLSLARHKITSAKGVVCVTDVRYDNEAALVRELGGKVIRIVRTDVDGAAADTHVSEAGVSDHLVDTVIENVMGRMDKLHEDVRQAARITKLQTPFPALAMVIDGVYSPEECQQLLTELESKPFERALINVGNGEQALNEEVRRHDRWMVDDEKSANSLWQRIKGAVIREWKYGGHPVGLNERLRFLRYGKGHYFMPHYDGMFRKDGACSLLTVMVYLNDGFEGGETVILNEDDVKFKTVYKPKAGSVLVFDQELYHEGRELLGDGMKMVVRTDVMFSNN
jgi:predicted 2-oxoglutarate/Fe(II)-dependent dioxygenase YbiX